jgi:type I restriction enzyme S subunit
MQASGREIPEELQAMAEKRQLVPDSKKLLHTNPSLAAQFPSAFEFNEVLGKWVPEGWEVKSLDKIADYQNGLALQKFRPLNEDDDFLPVLKISHLKDGNTDGVEKARIDINPQCRVDNGDILFSWSASLFVDIWCGGSAALNQHLFKVTSKKFPKWFYYLYTKHHLDNFIRIASDKAVTMGHIKREHLSEAMCSVMPMENLLLISSHFSNLIDKQIVNRLEKEKLAQLRDRLLPELISGRVRVDSPLGSKINVKD